MKKLQKTLSAVLTTGVLLSTMPMASAAEVQTDDIQLYAGDKIHYSMLMPETGQDSIFCFQCSITYNGDKIEYENFEWSDRVEKAELNSLIYNNFYDDIFESYMVLFNASTPCLYEFPAGEEFSTITFTVKEDMMLSEAGFENCLEEMGGCLDLELGHIDSIWRYKPTDEKIEVDFLNINHRDVTGDGRVNVMDATAIQKHIASLEILNSERVSRADVNNDGIVNVKDSTDLQKNILHI